jgi:hypothetical protein
MLALSVFIFCALKGDDARMAWPARQDCMGPARWPPRYAAGAVPADYARPEMSVSISK